MLDIDLDRARLALGLPSPSRSAGRWVLVGCPVGATFVEVARWAIGAGILVGSLLVSVGCSTVADIDFIVREPDAAAPSTSRSDDDDDDPASDPTPSSPDASSNAGGDSDAGVDAAGPVDASPDAPGPGGCTTTPFVSAGAASGAGSVSGSWANAGGARGIDGQTADFTFQMKNTASSFLMLTNFGLNVPSNARIQGLTVRVTRACNVEHVRDASLYLLENGSPAGQNFASAAEWGPMTSKTYGGEGDMWGLSLTPAAVNSASFGVALSAIVSTLGSYTTYPVASVDDVAVAVTYCE